MCASVRRPCVRKLAPIPTVVSQNVTNKNFLVCVMGEKYAFWSPTDPSQTAAAKAKLRYVYSISKPHGQSFKSPVRLLSCEAKPSYVHTILKNIPPQSRSQAVVCVSTPRMYPRSGYFLVTLILFHRIENK